jgi:hypothetical protein
MEKLLLVLLFSVKCAFAFAQNANAVLSTKKGIIVFESDNDMYFIATAAKDINALLNTGEDTVSADILYTSAGPYNFKNYLNRTIKFDTTTVNIRQENHLGQRYEAEDKLWTKYGSITYSKKKAYKLKRQYKTLYFNGQSLVVVLEDYLPIEMFTGKTLNLKAKKKSKAVH